MKTSNDQFPGEALDRIEYLSRFYGWSRFEAKCYFFYESYDPSDWVTYE
jgi:hypothetical protein